MKDELDINEVIRIARQAGDIIMKIYKKDFKIDYKDDNSPVTDADHAANEIIERGLAALAPDIPYLSEENDQPPYEKRKQWEKFWIIDPLDGTKEFIKKNGEFTVNIALVEEHYPVLGVVYAPAKDILYYGGRGYGAWKKEGSADPMQLPLTVNKAPEKKMTVVASRSHMSDETQAFVDELRTKTEQVELVSSGSSLKICLVAEGTADIYPRLAPTMEWDTAAAHAIALETGVDIEIYKEDVPLRYNCETLLNPWFVAVHK